MSFKAFQKLALQFAVDVRKLAREELLQELKAGNLFASNSAAFHQAQAEQLERRVLRELKTPKKPVAIRRPTVKPVHVPGGGVKCRAPGCRKLSKGPRYHYLCADHRTPPKSAKEAGKPIPTAGNGHRRRQNVVAEKPAVTSKNGHYEVATVVPGPGPVRIEYHGLKFTQEQWSRRLGLNKDAVRHRMRRGCTPLEALTMEKSSKRPRKAITP